MNDEGFACIVAVVITLIVGTVVLVPPAVKASKVEMEGTVINKMISEDLKDHTFTYFLQLNNSFCYRVKEYDYLHTPINATVILSGVYLSPNYNVEIKNQNI